ncbi:MAG: hypothetical protein RLZZ450_2 [Pseudomonadota bacterium]|jgi:hypothetical protein
MFMLALATLLYLTVSVVGVSAARPDYSHVRDTISQLGETGARLGPLTSYGVFLPVGFALAVIAYFSLAIDRHVALLAASLATGYLGGALFRCDPGAPSRGTWRQQVHNLCGQAEYLGGAYALYRTAVQAGPLTAAPAVVVVLVSAINVVTGQSRVRGLLQRIAELTLFISLALALLRSGA